MTTFETEHATLHRVREFVWEIEAEDGMRVPARVLASEALLEEISGDLTIQQIKNATHLPGIQKHAVCMPDGHQGYGFPVGGVAAIDTEEGCISPGAVGYDINCLAGETNVLMEFGRRREIRTLSDDFETDRAVVIDDGPEPAGLRLFTETRSRTVYEVVTETGDTVQATADHPFSTPSGMTELGTLQPGDSVYLHPFEGIRDETPPEFVVLAADDFADESSQLVQALEDRGLLPLKSTDPAFNRLLKLVGFHTGDGSFSGNQSWFYGEPADLQTIQTDIRALGFKPSRVYERERHHEMDGYEFDRVEYSVRSTARSFRELLVRLGAPDGRKVASDFTVPGYLDRLAGWQRALYLSAYFGAEMSTPSTLSAKNFYNPEVTNSRLRRHRNAGEEFMRDIARHLNDLGVETTRIQSIDSESDSGDRVRFRLGVKSGSQNLIRFFTTVGYRYNKRKQRRAIEAAQYLKTKERAIAKRLRIAEEVRTLADGGAAPAEIKRQFDVNDRFIERTLYNDRKGAPRPPAEFPDFEAFSADLDVRDDLTVGVEIASITELGGKPVFDIGVEHDAHNFVADGFVVSNCGVRMVKTNLTYDDLQGREEELVDELFASIPTGLGAGGVVEGTTDTIDEILARGMDWALEHDYAVEDDLAHCEDEGVRDDADPDAIDLKPKERGKTQIGSLGSGNHFLEVQRVTDVYLPEVAEAYGLAADQVVVLIHCGSRGLGHQVCTDYLRKIEREHGDLLAQLPDRELAAAPAGSRLAEDYYGAMCAAINFAWVNRQLITYQTRRVFERVFDRDWEDMEMDLLYDVAHNIAKKEIHDVSVAPDESGESGGSGEAAREEREVFVHRKGATRAFPAGHPAVPRAYRDVGQPVIIPGSMGSGSYVLRGGESSMALTFGSTAHGAGRLMSRTQAKKEYWGGDVQTALREQSHIYVRAASGATIAEEAPGVYKDVDEVVRVSDALGIGDKVARTFPVCNIKG